MTTLRIVLSCLLLSLAVAACDGTVEEAPDAAQSATVNDPSDGIGTSPSDPSEPVASQTSELRMECTETYDCGTFQAPRECCRCWEIVPCDFGLERCTFCN